MLKRGVLPLILCVGAAGPALADDDIPPVRDGQTYVQHLITQARAHNPAIRAIVVEGRRDGDKVPVVLGSSPRRASVFSPVAHPAPAHGSSTSAGRFTVHEPYVSSTGHAIGTITVTFAGHANPAALTRTAHALAASLAHATLSAKNAADPYPYDPAWGPTTYAQALTQRTVARHPDLLVMMIHATPPGQKTNIIIGSNIGRFGKPADEDDARVIDKGETNLEIGGEKDRFETELPLNDAHGTRIGALGLVFPYHDGADKEAIHKHGLAIRDEIARQIPASAALFERAR